MKVRLKKKGEDLHLYLDGNNKDLHGFEEVSLEDYGVTENMVAFLIDYNEREFGEETKEIVLYEGRELSLAYTEDDDGLPVEGYYDAIDREIRVNVAGKLKKSIKFKDLEEVEDYFNGMEFNDIIEGVFN